MSIDENLGRHNQQKVTTGQAVKAMALNGLGFVSAPLYLYAAFFQGKATEHLLGDNIAAEMLNEESKIISNLTDFHLQVLALLSSPFRKYYCFP